MLALGVLSVMVVAGAAAAELKVGDPAPPFSLKGSDGKTYSLDQFKGKSAVVIAWFPKAFTGGCTKECKSLRENSKSLHDLKFAYFTASVDTPEENEKFAKSLDLDYPILSDPDKSVAKEYGVLQTPARSRQSLDVLHRQGRHHQGDRQEGQRAAGRPRHRRQAERAGTDLGFRVTVGATRPQTRGPFEPASPGRWALSSAQRHFSSPRIRQKSRLCISPGTRRHARDPNVNGSVYSRWWATSCRNVSKSSSIGPPASALSWE